MTETTKARKRSSIFLRARNSFYRSKGERGADVDTLRGNSGSNFENEAVVTRGGSGLGFFSCFGKTNYSGKKYILVKGPHIFVFNQATSSAPKFAIPLKHEIVNVHVSKGKTQIVALETGLGDVQYEFRFDLSENDGIAKEFGRVLKEQILVGNSDVVKKKLGHRSDKKSSIKYADSIGLKKEEDQPEWQKDITTKGFNDMRLAQQIL
mmetsp:Transcript_6293/g.7781  ORF Transcript_6293/g.7781 Transcript_6293/m.7781 type:complete len:208 (-) Transcript_6293:299-922(-)